MLKRKRNVIISLLVGTFFFAGFIADTSEMKAATSKTMIEVQRTHIAQEPPALLKGIGQMSVKENLVVEDVSVPLYVTFDSQEQALQNISGNPVIQKIKDIWKLGSYGLCN